MKSFNELFPGILLAYVNGTNYTLTADDCNELTKWAAGAERISKAGEWISVKDRLPEIGVDVIAYGKIPNSSIFGKARYLGFSVWETSGLEEEWFTVTHWMLPEPPAPEIPDDIQTIVKNLDDMRGWLDKEAGE